MGKVGSTTILSMTANGKLLVSTFLLKNHHIESSLIFGFKCFFFSRPTRFSFPPPEQWASLKWEEKNWSYTSVWGTTETRLRIRTKILILKIKLILILANIQLYSMKKNVHWIRYISGINRINTLSSKTCRTNLCNVGGNWRNKCFEKIQVMKTQ